jgi:mRNA-degrading endonuclease RelE of RelBE toxin-antitoxin system
MATKLIPSDLFQKELKRLARKFPAVLKEVETLSQALEDDQRPGDKIPNIAFYEAYKVRLKNSSAKKGKSGGFRVIYYVYIADTVVLLTIYSKSEQDNISSEAIQSLIDDNIPDEPESDKSL